MSEAAGTDAAPSPAAKPTAEQVVPILRERLYGSLACLSTLLVLLQHVDDGESGAGAALLDVAVAAASLWAASLLSDYVAHLTVHGQGPRAGDALHMLRASGQILEASVLPALFLVASAAGLLALPLALQLGSGVSVLTLGVFALLAARRTRLAPWKRVLIVAALTGLGALVVVVKTVAHG